MKQELIMKNYSKRSDILYSDFDTFTKLLESGGENIDAQFLTNRILKIFYGLDTKTARRLKQDQVDKLLEKITTVLALPETPFKNIITMGGIQYGFIPNFGDITSGELIDIEDCYERQDYVSLTAILYRPLIGNINKLGEYVIEDYNGYDDKFKNISLDVVEGYMSLFTKSFLTLNHCILLSINKMKN